MKKVTISLIVVFLMLLVSGLALAGKAKVMAKASNEDDDDRVINGVRALDPAIVAVRPAKTIDNSFLVVMREMLLGGWWGASLCHQSRVQKSEAPSALPMEGAT